MIARLVLVFIMLCSTLSVKAEDLGYYGPVYMPGKDGRTQIQDILRQKQKSGQLAKFWTDYRAKVLASIKNPPPLGVATNYKSRVEMRDFTFTYQSDFKDQNGRVRVKKGTVIHPLQISHMHTALLFIDGRDQRQINYAINMGRKIPIKIVLTAGSPYLLRIKYQNYGWFNGKNIPFYFDQRKMIINSLKMLYGVNINSVPVLMQQVGSKMKFQYGM